MNGYYPKTHQKQPRLIIGHIEYNPAHLITLRTQKQSIMHFFNKNMYNEKMYNLEILSEMNEIYISNPKNGLVNSSDKVFVNRHCDGPYYLWPFCSVYRVLIGINRNDFIITCFSEQNCSADGNEIIIDVADVVGFDYHRTEMSIGDVT